MTQPETFDLGDELAVLLRSERELPSPQFSAKLDAWADAGFPRATAPVTSPRHGWDGLRARLAATPPRRILAPAGAALTLIVVIAVAIGEAGNLGGSDNGTVAVQSVPDSGGTADSTALKEAQTTTRGPLGDVAGSETATAQGTRSGAHLSLSAAPHSAAAVPPNQRKIARTVDLALATSASDFRDAADGVLDVVQTHHGFVRTSNVSGGDPGVKGSELGQAHFDLRIPAGQLEPVLGELSDLGHVVSRTDGTKDITSSFVSVKKHIAALEQTRANLLHQLQNAVTIAEQESIKRRLDIVEGQLQSAEGQRSDLQRRVRLVPVSVTISADNAIGASGGGDGDWSIGDAVDDAGRVLEVAAGVLVISAAVLVPVGLVALVALLSGRELRRRQREAALD
jgi:hypothetical protein